MQVIQLPSIYDQERASAPKPNPRRYLAVAAVGAAACLAVAAIFRGAAVAPMAATAVSWALCVGFYALINTNRPMGQGEIGERTALRDLSKSALLAGDEYACITSCRIPGYERIGDLDIIVAGPMGAVVIEVKNFLRPIRVSGDTWTAESAHGGAPMKSVSRQLDNEVKALAKFLGRADAQVPVHGIIAINANAVILIDEAPPYPVVAYHALDAAVAALPPSDPPVPVQQIVGLLASGAARMPPAALARKEPG